MNAIINSIISLTEDYRKEIANKQIAKLEEKQGFSLSQFAKDTILLETHLPLVKGLGNYLLPTDELGKIHFYTYGNNGVEVSFSVIRDGEEYNITTESIIAGGYEVCLHTRYLVKTKLRKIANQYLKEFNAKIKRRNKIQTEESVLNNLISRIPEAEEKIKEAQERTDEIINKEAEERFLQYEDLNKACYYAQLTKEQYNKERAINIKEWVSSQKKFRKWGLDALKDLNKKIAKQKEVIKKLKA